MRRVAKASVLMSVFILQILVTKLQMSGKPKGHCLRIESRYGDDMRLLLAISRLEWKNIQVVQLYGLIQKSR